MSDLIPCYKCVRPNGRDFRTNSVDYAKALADGVAVECLDAAPANGAICGHGLHVSPTVHKTIQFADKAERPWRWFEGTVLPEDIVEKDDNKMRVRRFTPTKEIGLSDIFGPDFAQRIEAVKAESASWKDIPWLKTTKKTTKKKIESLVKKWRKAITPWLRNKEYQLPTAVRIVKTAADAAAAAIAASAVVDDAVAAASATADAASAVESASTTAAAAIAAASATADDASATAAADAAATADAAAADVPYWWRWYLHPRYTLWRMAQWNLAGMTEPNPWAPLVELYRLGCRPIGFVKGEFVVYSPRPK